MKKTYYGRDEKLWFVLIVKVAILQVTETFLEKKCLRYLGNFSPISSDNAFSYFTTIIRHSFIENIKKEYSYSNVKSKVNTNFFQATAEEQCEMQESYNGNA